MSSFSGKQASRVRNSAPRPPPHLPRVHFTAGDKHSSNVACIDLCLDWRGGALDENWRQTSGRGEGAKPNRHLNSRNTSKCGKRAMEARLPCRNCLVPGLCFAPGITQNYQSGKSISLVRGGLPRKINSFFLLPKKALAPSGALQIVAKTKYCQGADTIFFIDSYFW